MLEALVFHPFWCLGAQRKGMVISMEKKILKKRQSASQETKELSEQGAEKSNSGLITAGMLLYSKTELSEARGRLFLVESVDAETGEITALGLTTKAVSYTHLPDPHGHQGVL